MTTITVVKVAEDTFTGAGEKDKKAYNRFKQMLKDAGEGEMFTLEYWFPRNLKFHKLHFVMIHAIYDAQEQFHNLDHLRDWLTVGAGHAIFVPGPKGKGVAIPDSIAFRKMDDEQFSAHHQAVKDFLRSTYATRFLWPHLSDPQASEMVETILSQFERESE